MNPFVEVFLVGWGFGMIAVGLMMLSSRVLDFRMQDLLPAMLEGRFLDVMGYFVAIGVFVSLGVSTSSGLIHGSVSLRVPPMALVATLLGGFAGNAVVGGLFLAMSRVGSTLAPIQPLLSLLTWFLFVAFYYPLAALTGLGVLVGLPLLLAKAIGRAVSLDSLGIAPLILSALLGLAVLHLAAGLSDAVAYALLSAVWPFLLPGTVAATFVGLRFDDAPVGSSRAWKT